MHKRGRDLVTFFGLPKARKVTDEQEQPGSVCTKDPANGGQNHKATVHKSPEPSENRHVGQNRVAQVDRVVHNVPKASTSTAATRRIYNGGANSNTKGCRPHSLHVDHKRSFENSAVQTRQEEGHRCVSEHRHAGAKLSTEHGDENGFPVASTDDYHHWANFLPSQHPADVPRLEYFSGEACPSGREDEEGGEPVEQSGSLRPHPTAQSCGGLMLSCGAQLSAVNPSTHQGSCRSEVEEQRGGVHVSSTAADVTEAHTPKLHHMSKDAQVSTLLTLAASTQSPRNAVSGIAEQELGQCTEKEQDASPYSVDAATVLDPPALVPAHGTAKDLRAPAADIAPCPLPITGDSAQHSVTSDQPGATADRVQQSAEGAATGEQGLTFAAENQAIKHKGACGCGDAMSAHMHRTAPASENTSHTSNTVQTTNGVQAVAADLDDDDEDEDEDDMLFSVDLTNLGTTSTGGGAAGTVRNPICSATPPITGKCLERPTQVAYGAAAEAVMPRSRLQHTAEEAVVSSITGWGQGEQGLTIRQQREVDRHIVHQVECQEGYETVLVVQHVASGSRRWVHLRGGWMDAPICAGDPINVVLVNEAQGWQQAPNGELHITVAQDGAVLLVLYPDTLISSTSIAAALDCPRDAILKERGYGAPSRAALMGTMMHDVVQSSIQALAAGEISEPTTGPHRPAPVKRENRSDRSTSAIWGHMMGRIPEVVSENVVNLAEVGMTQREAERELRAAAGQLAATLSSHFRHTPTVPGNTSNAPQASIEGLMDIEESIWAPRYGLKGYIDATVLVRELTVSQNVDAGNAGSTGKLGLAALEFKSGKQHHSHHAQLGTYGLLLQSRYGVEAAAGLLWYSRMENMEFASKGPRDVAGLMMTRNKLAAYKAHDGAWNLPPPIQQDHRCRSCFSLPLCAAIHRTLEGGTVESFGLDVFTELTAHIEDKDATFLRTWLELLETERNEAKKKYPQENIWAVDPPPCTRPVKQTSPGKMQIPSCTGTTALDTGVECPAVCVADCHAAAASENTSPNCPAKCMGAGDAYASKHQEGNSVGGASIKLQRHAPSQSVLRAALSSTNTPLLPTVAIQSAAPASALPAPADAKHVLEGRCIGHLHLQSYLGKDDQSPFYPYKYTFIQRQLSASGAPLVHNCSGGEPSVEALSLSSQGFAAGDCGILSLQGRHVAVNRAQVESVSSTVLTVRLRSRLAAGFEHSCTNQASDGVDHAPLQGAGCSSKGSGTPTAGNCRNSTCLWRIDKDEPETAFQIAVSGLLELIVSSSVHTARLRSLLIHYEPPKQEAKVRYGSEAPADADHLEAMIESEYDSALHVPINRSFGWSTCCMSVLMQC